MGDTSLVSVLMSVFATFCMRTLVILGVYWNDCPRLNYLFVSSFDFLFISEDTFFVLELLEVKET